MLDSLEWSLDRVGSPEVVPDMVDSLEEVSDMVDSPEEMGSPERVVDSIVIANRSFVASCGGDTNACIIVCRLDHSEKGPVSLRKATARYSGRRRGVSHRENKIAPQCLH